MVVVVVDGTVILSYEFEFVDKVGKSDEDVLNVDDCRGVVYVFDSIVCIFCLDVDKILRSFTTGS